MHKNRCRSRAFGWADGLEALRMVEMSGQTWWSISGCQPWMDSVRDELLENASTRHIRGVIVTGEVDAFGDRLHEEVVLKNRHAGSACRHHPKSPRNVNVGGRKALQCAGIARPNDAGTARPTLHIRRRTAGWVQAIVARPHPAAPRTSAAAASPYRQRPF